MTKKHKVLVIGPYPPPFAGPEMAIKMLLESPLHNEFILQHLPTNVRKKNVFKGRVGLTMLGSFFRFFSLLFWRLISFRPKVVYYFVTATKLGWLGRDVWCITLAKLFGAKVIIHMRAGHFHHRIKSAPSYQQAIIRWACHRANLCLVQAPSLKSQFENLAPTQNIKVLPNMIDVHKYRAVTQKSFQRGRILFLGHLSTAKGYCELLKIIPRIARTHPTAKFAFAGTKLDKERNVLHVQTTGELLPKDDPDMLFDQKIKHQFEDNYEYLGVLDEPAKLAQLQLCDFLVLPSFSEGFSMAVLEAMSMGKPVVCTAVGAMRDFVINGTNGLTLEPGDTDGLAVAVESLLSDLPLRDNIAKENAVYVRQNFSQKIIADKLTELIYHTISDK